MQASAPRIGSLLVLLTMLGCEKSVLDEQVRKLCAEDGGIKVYETVRLPSNRFNEWGQPKVHYSPGGDGALLGQEYLIQRETRYYAKGNPEMWRYHYKVTRRSDGKLLGESIGYSRRGGDVPGPWHESSFTCPPEGQGGNNVLLNRVFLPGDEKTSKGK